MNDEWRLFEALNPRGMAPRPAHPNGRRFIIVHLDGVSRAVLAEAFDHGRMPRLLSRLERGQLELTPCHAGSPSSTPCFQAGLLYGVRPNVPGFSWFDKWRRRHVRMDCADDAGKVEREISRGSEGLLQNGTSYFSLFSGGSCVTGWCRSGRLAPARYQAAGNRWDQLGSASVHLLRAGPMGLQACVDAGRAVADGLRWLIQTGRSDHEVPFLFNRVLLSAGAREIAVTASSLDVMRGIPAIYCCFADYDEVSHRRGPRSAEANRALESTDRSLDRLLTAVDGSRGAYDVYVIADHGQVATRPLESLVGKSLRRSILEHKGASPAPLQGHESLERDLVCVDAGNVAHVYLIGDRLPLSLAELRARYGRVLEAVEHCPGAGVVAVRGGSGGFARWDGAWLDLADPTQASRLDRGLGHGQAAQSVRQMLALSAAGDVVVYGNGARGGDVAFAWEFGSHGGIGRDEMEIFALHPPGMAEPFRTMEHAQDLHRFFQSRYRHRSEPVAVVQGAAQAAG